MVWTGQQAAVGRHGHQLFEALWWAPAIDAVQPLVVGGRSKDRDQQTSSTHRINQMDMLMTQSRPQVFQLAPKDKVLGEERRTTLGMRVCRLTQLSARRISVCGASSSRPRGSQMTVESWMPVIVLIRFVLVRIPRTG